VTGSCEKSVEIDIVIIIVAIIANFIISIGIAIVIVNRRNFVSYRKHCFINTSNFGSYDHCFLYPFCLKACRYWLIN
jgi:hypothetical protein